MNLKSLKKLSKEKRQHLVLVGLVTVGVVVALGPFHFEILGLGGLINHQFHTLDSAGKKTEEARDELKRVQDAVKHAEQTRTQLSDAKTALAAAETDIASGDLYAWVVNTLRQFKTSYKVEIPQFQPVGPASDVTLIPAFPYKQTAISVSGTAHFHDLGRFLADLENQFPHMRVVNLSLDLNSSPTTEDQETVAFKLDIVTLVKNSSS